MVSILLLSNHNSHSIFAMSTPILAPEGPYIVGQHKSVKDGVTLRHRIVFWAAQTGDIPHVAAALALDPFVDVIILYTTSMQANADAANDTFLNACAASRLPPGPQPDSTVLKYPWARVRLVQCTSDEETLEIFSGLKPKQVQGKTFVNIGKACWHTFDKVKPRFQKDLKLWTYETSVKPKDSKDDKAREDKIYEYPSITPVGSTELIAMLFKTGTYPGGFYDFVGHALGSPKVSQVDISDWAAKRFAKTAFRLPAPGATAQKMKILLLWSRYSGQNTDSGYNPEGDSDPVGQSELIKFGRDLGFTVLTIGHDASWATSQQNEAAHGDIHLGEFWNEASTPQIPNPFLDKGRPGQTSFYVSLARNHNVVQIGQKTGGMDNAALVGIPTIYIEDVKSPSNFRMKMWVSVLRYTGAEVSRPPTILGKYLRALTEDETRALRDRERAFGMSPEKVRKEVKEKAKNWAAQAKVTPGRILLPSNLVFQPSYISNTISFISSGIGITAIITTQLE
ncbi:hypothetical protein QCA50_020389 [Cerrena zonata]|uniref:Uncharacterized protein n=1 Tax=Cerrena zonata TaxID=2478898 RepID=A0AAW0F988_9APHY